VSFLPLHEPLLPVLKALLSELPGPAPTFALDLGCGDGNTLPLLRERWPELPVLGADLDPAALEAARGAPYVGLVVADAHRLPLRAASVEFVWCCATLGLLTDARRALAELARALRPGGRALIVTATQRWVLRLHWPPELRSTLGGARPEPWAAPICDAEIGRELREMLTSAGLQGAVTRAWPLDAGLDDELALAEWPRLRALLGKSLDQRTGAACAEVAVRAEPAVVALLVATLATKPLP
jgi:SAM-dependent methyltransferase